MLICRRIKRAKAEGQKCHAKTMRGKKSLKLLNKNPSCAAEAEHRGGKTREGAKSVVGLLERMKHGRGIKGLDDKSRGMEILIAEAFAKIKPSEPLMLAM
jgi:hypothetical protein